MGELHTFIDVFNKDIELKEKTVKLNKIIIPMIQRDYAQGRKDRETRERIREPFLDALKQAVCDKPITLDFIYGDIDDNGEMIPLDGQQRLTTLFLLHWYAAKKEHVADEKYSFLKNFSYQTRFSSREFCEELIKFNPSFEKELSKEIVDQAWFPLEWLKDPTVSSMLVMLDNIDKKFRDIKGIWESLKNGAIKFYFLAIEDMGLTDELYIKMNSRGKPLTPFEHFKAELERSLKEVDEEVAKGLIRKINEEWTDLLWEYKGEDCVIDDEFLRYFRFVCDIIYYLSDGDQQKRPEDEFDIVKLFFSKDCPDVLGNVEKLENFFDCWCNLDADTPSSFCNSVFTLEHNPEKVLINDEIDIFGDCLRTYADVLGNRNRKFPLHRIIMLYAVVSYLINNLTNKDAIEKKDFVRRLRVVNNLILNSTDEIRDSDNKSRMPEILKQVKNIIVRGHIDPTIKQNFNTNQIEEELQKEEWLKNNPELKEKLYKLEDHDLLRGQIGIIGLENIRFADRFYELFNCDRDLVDCALLTVGNYLQRERNGWRYQAGSGSAYISEAWRDLFHKSNALFNQDRTKYALNSLLLSASKFDDDVLKEKKDRFIKECELNNSFDWRYYYIKYDSIRPYSHGKYCWDNFDECPYVFYVMLTKTNFSENTFAAYFKELETDGARISREEKGRYLIVGKKYIKSVNDGYEIYNIDTNELVEKVTVRQNADGIDIENRVDIGKQIVSKIISNQN